MARLPQAPTRNVLRRPGIRPVSRCRSRAPGRGREASGRVRRSSDRLQGWLHGTRHHAKVRDAGANPRTPFRKRSPPTRRGFEFRRLRPFGNRRRNGRSHRGWPHDRGGLSGHRTASFRFQGHPKDATRARSKQRPQRRDCAATRRLALINDVSRARRRFVCSDQWPPRRIGRVMANVRRRGVLTPMASTAPYGRASRSIARTRCSYGNAARALSCSQRRSSDGSRRW